MNVLLAVLKLPSGQNNPLPYIITLIPPLVLSLLDPEIFFKALDFAGTYGGITITFSKFFDHVILHSVLFCSVGIYYVNIVCFFTVLVLFGILPAAMSWSDRYSEESSGYLKLPELVPGGKLTLSLVIGGAGLVILTEVIEKFGTS